MAITHVFKGRSDIYGTFAYIEDNELVIGENASLDPEIDYHGPSSDFLLGELYVKLFHRNRELARDIWDYYTYNGVKPVDEAVKQKEKNMTKLCEIKVDRVDSLKDMVYHLTANGYEVQASVIWKEFPNTGIDCWQIAIFEKEKN